MMKKMRTTTRMRMTIEAFQQEFGKGETILYIYISQLYIEYKIPTLNS